MSSTLLLTHVGGDLGGGLRGKVPQSLRWGTAHACIRPPNILKTLYTHCISSASESLCGHSQHRKARSDEITKKRSSGFLAGKMEILALKGHSEICLEEFLVTLAK